MENKILGFLFFFFVKEGIKKLNLKEFAQRLVCVYTI